MNTDIEINGNMELSKHSPLEQFDDVMEENVEEKAVSKSQQRFFGMVDAYKNGDMPNASPAIKKAAKGMTKKEVKDFAKTKHKGLPERISEAVDREIGRKIKEATNSKYVLYADTMKSGNSDFMADMEEQILKKNVKKALDYVPEEAIVSGEKEIPSSKVFSGEVALEKDGYVFIRNNNSPHDFLIYKKMKNTIKESTLRKIIREALSDNASSKANINETINEISNDTADWAYKEAMRRSGILDFGSPQRVKNDILMKSLKKHRNDKLGFDPDAVSKQIRQSGTTGDEKLDRKWATWEQNRIDRKNGNRTYDEKTGRWTTHLTEGDLRSIIRETVQTHLVDVLSKYTQGKTSSKEANKAIMDLANLSNKKKPVNEAFDDEWQKMDELSKDNFYATLIQLRNIVREDGIIDASEAIDDYPATYCVYGSEPEYEGKLQQLRNSITKSVIRTLYNYDAVCLDDENTLSINVQQSNIPQAAELCIKLQRLASNPLNESYAQEGNYTHFAVNKQTNKIVNGWDYSEHENSQLKQYAKDYFIRDLVDYGLDPKQYTILTRVGCKKRGINPDDDNQWENI